MTKKANFVKHIVRSVLAILPILIIAIIAS